MRALRTANEAGRRRILRKLHLRWWHAAAAPMKRILKQAGQPEELSRLVDDIVDSGGTLCNAAKAILDANALTVRAYITHGVLSDDACQKVEKSVLEELVITDSIPDRCPKNCKKTRQVSVSQLFGEAIRRVTNEESVSSLFS